MDLRRFREVVICDFEFYTGSGNHPTPVCLAFEELFSGRNSRVWFDEFGERPPYAHGPDVLFVCYYASADLGCHQALEWGIPECVLDLYVEFRNLTNSLIQPGKGRNSLLGALQYFGIDGLGVEEKADMRALIMRGKPYNADEKSAILNYCETDIVACRKLMPCIIDKIDWPHAAHRSRYMKAATQIEWNGVPLDVELYDRMLANWGDMKDQLIARIDADYGVYEGRRFVQAKWMAYLDRIGLRWPMTEWTQNKKLKSMPVGWVSKPCMKDDTFRAMAKAFPIIAPVRELRYTLSKMKLHKLQVGDDGRNRAMLSAFRARTGRNQPGNSEFIFGPAVWLRGLIKPPPGFGIAYLDWKSQEFGAAAALSGDMKMWEAYKSGDPYWAFARQAGLAPMDVLKPEIPQHKMVREQCKRTVLAVQYGMSAEGLADWLSITSGETVIPLRARQLLRLHRDTYRVFWKWSDSFVMSALGLKYTNTMFDWRVHCGNDDVNERFLMNFPMQGNGAEMLRLACCLGIEAGIEICAPVHDAVLICAPLDRLDHDVARMQGFMAEASRIVLGEAFELGTDKQVVCYPYRFRDDKGRGDKMWCNRPIAAALRARG